MLPRTAAKVIAHSNTFSTRPTDISEPAGTTTRFGRMNCMRSAIQADAKKQHANPIAVRVRGLRMTGRNLWLYRQLKMAVATAANPNLRAARLGSWAVTSVRRIISENEQAI